jgi:hypothetical protein
MNTGLKITVFAAALAATFTATYGVGQVVGTVGGGERSAAHGGHEEEAGKAGKKEADGHRPAPAGGLQVSEGGYTLALETPRIAAGAGTELRFSVRDANGRRITAYEREHGKELHFIVASRDLAVYRHLHPTRAADGTWSTTADLPTAGAYRAFADFKPAAAGAGGVTLGADLAVSGTYAPAKVPAPAATAVVDGYEVTLDGGLRPGKRSELGLKVTRNGKPVTDLQPYLGAYGHLVALRSGDLAYVHVHPNGEPRDGSTAPGPEISFTTTAPGPGTYRLFLDFRHGGEVRTAAFTVEAGTAAEDPAPAPAGDVRESPGHEH